MANGAYLRQMRRIFDGGTVAGLSEGQLLERFISRRDEAAFEALVIRHGPMVFGVCRRILRDPADAEDAFQATFLVLVRQARSIRGRDSLGGWLHRVAYRVAIRANADRRKPEAVDLDSLAAPEAADRDLIALIHEELERLPSKYRVPIILCDLENHTHEEAAQALHWPLGTVKGRLSRARNLLKDRLIRRGVGAPAVAVGLALGRDAKAIVSPVLLDSTVRAALSVSAGKVLIAGVASAVAVGLAQGVSRTMFLQTIKLGAAALIAFSLVGVAGVGTLAQVPGGEGNGAAIVGVTKEADPSPPDLPAPAVFGKQAAENPPKTDPDLNASDRETWQAKFAAWSKSLQGTWKVVDRIDGSLEGVPLPFREKVVITRGRIQLAEPGEADLEYGIDAIASKKGHLSPLFGEIRNQRYPCVFSLHGNSLTIIYTLPGPGVKSPNPFDLLPEKGRFIVWLEREGSKPATSENPPVASPDADITKLQGNWILSRQIIRYGGKQFDLRKADDKPVMYGEIGQKFRIDGDKIIGLRSPTGAPQVTAKIDMYDGGASPKQIDISPTENQIPASRGVPIGKGIYTLNGNDEFTVCYDPIHPELRPRVFPDNRPLTVHDTHVVSTFKRIPTPEVTETHANGNLLGCWKLVSITQQGVEDFSSSWTAVFTDDWYGEIYGDRIDFKGPYQVEKDVEPWRFKLLDANNGGMVLAEIYKIEGDRLTVCLVPANPRGAASFPTDFEPRPGSRNVLYTYEWAGPITDDIRSQLQKTRSNQRMQREAQRRKLTEVAAGREPLPPVEQPNEGPIRAPVDLDAKRVEKELAEMEVASLKSRIMDLYKNIRSQEDVIFRAQHPGSSVERATPEELEAMENSAKRLNEDLKNVTTEFFHKSKGLSRYARELKSLSAPPEEPELSPTLPNSLPAARRLADFDRRIRALQQQRDAYLMSLPDEERQTLLKQIAP
jgi:RNA polymerase sigma factor (sigma-70 family)